MRRPCDWCGKEYDAQRATAKFCGATCRQRAKRGGEPGPESNVDRVRVELEEAGVADSALAGMALTLAATLDAGRDTASAKAAAVRELRATLMAAKAEGVAPASRLDLLRARRDAKLA